MQIKEVTRERAADLKLKNEPFSRPGRFVPSLCKGIWRWETELYTAPLIQTFPDENYDYDALRKTGVLLGAYEADRCIGLAIMQDHFLKHMYLYDLKVNAAHRGRGVGTALIRACQEAAQNRGYQGIYTVAQDDNLKACLFYLHAGFRIGGYDNRVYAGTSQAGKGDVIFYLEGTV